MDKQIAKNEGAMVDLLNQEMKELQESQSQIEELAKVLCPSYENKKDCETCPTEWCQAEEYAVMAICNGYRKIPEIPKNTVLTNNDIAELLSIVARDTRKETAEKIAHAIEALLKERFIGLTLRQHLQRTGMEEGLKMALEIAKEITEGV